MILPYPSMDHEAVAVNWAHNLVRAHLYMILHDLTFHNKLHEFETLNIHDFPGFPCPVQTLLTKRLGWLKHGIKVYF